MNTIWYEYDYNIIWEAYLIIIIIIYLDDKCIPTYTKVATCLPNLIMPSSGTRNLKLNSHGSVNTHRKPKGTTRKTASKTQWVDQEAAFNTTMRSEGWTHCKVFYRSSARHLRRSLLYIQPGMGAHIPSTWWSERAACCAREIWPQTCAYLRLTFLKCPGDRGEWRS